MKAELLTMSAKEVNRLGVVQRVVERRLAQVEAATILSLTTRQVRRLVKRYFKNGPAGLVSAKRGKPGHHRLAAGVRTGAIELVRSRYADFGPTLAAEKLRERHGIVLSVETLRQLMIADGLWIPRKLRNARVHQPRERRACVGELVQIDGCDHHWFEDRGPRCTILAFVDDATSQLMQLSFVQDESTFEYFATTRRYLEQHGKPTAFYSDKHSVFKVNKTNAATGTGITQFGRALADLQISLICAHSPAAKGRVERTHLTLQDRLVKELRLAQIDSMVEANAFASTFVIDYNHRFGKPPRSSHDAHRPLQDNEDLEDIFCWQEERTVMNNLTLRYDRVQYLIEPTTENLALRNHSVSVFDFPEGRVEIRDGSRVLKHEVEFHKATTVRQADVVSNKRLSTILGMIRADQMNQPQRRSGGPKRHLGQLGGRSD
jgi:hypothetical protein